MGLRLLPDEGKVAQKVHTMRKQEKYWRQMEGKVRSARSSVMHIEKYESRSIRDEIRNVFMDVWDPIGIKDVGNARHEYDMYIGKIYGMLTGGATDEEIGAELLRIERERMELAFPGSNMKRAIASLRGIEYRSSRARARVSDAPVKQLAHSRFDAKVVS